LGLGLRQLYELHRADGEAFLEDAVEDLARVAVLDGVGLDDSEGAFHDESKVEGRESGVGISSERAVCDGEQAAKRRWGRRGVTRPRRRPARGPAPERAGDRDRPRRTTPSQPSRTTGRG